MPDPFVMLAVASPSGTGKTTLCKRLRREFPSLVFSVSTTTRPPRPSERDGVDYHFVDDATFDQMVDGGAFVEWEAVHAHRYGTSHAEIERGRAAGRSLLFDVDWRGAMALKAAYPEIATVFLLPPSLDELERRIRGRADVAEEQIRLRLANALLELRQAHRFEYVVINVTVDEAYDRLRAVFRAAGSRRVHYAREIEELLAAGERRAT
jgi:guanylate kinase